MAIIQYVLFLCLAGVFATSNEGSTGTADTYPFSKIGSQYYLVNTGVKMNWFEAALVCRTYDSDLVTIETVDEMNALSFYLIANGHGDKYFWTSGSDLGVEGKFMSLSNGRPMTYAKWSGGQPDNAGNNEDCVHIWNVNNIFHMNDYPCTGQGYPICEMRRQSKSFGEENCSAGIPKCAIDKFLQRYLQTADLLNCT